MRNLMRDICVGTIMASAALSAQFAMANGTAEAGVSDSDVKYLSFPAYEGDGLELTIVGNDARFRLWSPEAEAAELRLYSNARGGTPFETRGMSRSESGTWVANISPVPYGSFYTFRIKHQGKWLDETPGIWAKAVGVNGLRGAVIDLSKTDPTGWAEDRGPALKHINDAVIYELHHRDFSVHPNSGIVNKGKFIAMLEDGTVTPLGDKTGIDHLKELGVTHVHILPSYDYNSVDETQLPSNTYNWGCLLYTSDAADEL